MGRTTTWWFGCVLMGIAPVHAVAAWTAPLPCESINWTSDSIFLDDRAISIEARVRFDSLGVSRQARDLDVAPIAIEGWEVNLWFGAGGRPDESYWHQWTGDRDHALNTSFALWNAAQSPVKRSGQLEWTGIVGLTAVRMQSVDATIFPDSLIGFIPRGEDGPLRMVVYERFSIGVETDTVTLMPNRQWSVVPHAGLRMTGKTNRLFGALELGVARIASHTERVMFQPPTLTEPAFIPGASRAVSWTPTLQWQVGSEIPQSAWRVHASGRIIFGYQQNHWLGIGVSYAVS